MKNTMLFRSLQYSALVVAVALSLAPAVADEGYQPIFNGKDLQGWKVPENNVWWLVKDGVLQVRSSESQEGNELWTEKHYRDFVIELEFKFIGGTVDSGVHIRNSDQIQIGISGSLRRDMTASPYIPQKRGYPVEAEGVADLLKADDWNSMKIKAVGKTYTIELNGKHVLTYESDTAAEEGPIGLQLHAKRDMQIDYRNLRVLELKAAKSE